MNAYEYIDANKVALLKSTEAQIEEEYRDLRANFKGEPRLFDAAWSQFLKINEGKFTNVSA